MVLGPIGLRQHVVDNIEPAAAEERQSFIQELIFPGHGIREDQIKGTVGLLAQEPGGICCHKLQSGVTAEEFTRHRLW